MSEKNAMNRREFVKAVSGVTALGGGLYLMGAMGEVEASVDHPALNTWSERWWPESPKRLSDVTHALAQRAQTGEHGRSMSEAAFALDETTLPVGASADVRYAYATKLVAENAPLRLLPGERIVGSATLREAAAHRAPVAGVSSTSHTTLGFDRILKSGYQGLRQQIDERLARGGFEPSASASAVVAEGRSGEAFRTSHGCAYWAEAKARPEYSTPPLTVECWAKLHSKDAFNVIVLNKNKDSRFHWELYSYAGTGCFSAYLPGYAPAEVKSERIITDGQWHYLAMVFADARVRLYVDGEQVADAAVTAAGDLGDGSGNLYFGGYPPHSIGCNGEIDEVRVSNVARTVAAIPTAPLEVDAATLGLWRMGRLNGDVALVDAGPSANAGIPVIAKGGADLLEAMRLCLDAATIWHKRYLDALDERIAASTGDEQAAYRQVRETLERVPETPAETFREAVQSLWFAYAFQRLMGTWSGIGRIDEMLGPYLARDLGAGRITLDEAREVLAHFWVKGCEWIGAFDTRGSGDAQHYQNIVLSGVNAAGEDVTNDVTYIVLDIVEELHISDFPIAVRLNTKSPEKLLRRIAEVQRHGGGIVALYNEDIVIPGLVKFGYSLEEARRFANDGCWETIVPGKTAFSYVPFDALALLHEVLGLKDAAQPAPEYADFDSLYAAYVARLGRQVDHHNAAADGWVRSGPPAPLVSLLVEDCIERGRGYYERGAHYAVLAPHAGRLANVANSLHVIQRLVFEENYLTLPEFVAILRNDWADNEQLRGLVLNRFAFYGNDDDEADAMMTRVFNDYTELVARVREREGVLRPCGISTFGREIEWRQGAASPDGHHNGEVLATNCSPSPGTDRQGPTAVIKSYCKLDFTRCPNGATVELKVHPDTVKDDRGLDAMVALMRGFVNLGGMFMHVDVVDTAMLIDAQRHPEKYPNLAVRIAGWSARFATLNKEWQDMVIGRTQQMV